jgi:hypothetical protein
MKQLGEVVGKLVTVTSEYVRRATVKECIAVVERGQREESSGEAVLSELRKLRDSEPAIAQDVLRFIREGVEQ